MDESKDVTIYDIAKALNVSAATVSRGLNNHPGISPITKKQIHDKAKDLGYRSNTSASNLRKQKTNTIGVIVPKLNSRFVASALAGMEKVATENGYNLIISQSFETVEKEATNASTMLQNRVAGLIVSLSYDTTDFSHFDPFLSRKIPLLFFDRVTNFGNAPKIIIDNFRAGLIATSHLIEQGSENIIHITGNQNRNVYQERKAGYEQALQNHNLPIKNENLIINDLSMEAGAEAAKTILNMDPLPDGIFSANDICAASCMNVLKDHGINIPQDIAIVGFNNDPVAELIYPPLSSINYPALEMGRIVTLELISILKGEKDYNSVGQTITLDFDLIKRASSLRKAYKELK